MKYPNSFKKKAVLLTKRETNRTIDTARELQIPLKTLESWITLYNKDSKVFDKEKTRPKDYIY